MEYDPIVRPKSKLEKAKSEACNSLLENDLCAHVVTNTIRTRNAQDPSLVVTGEPLIVPESSWVRAGLQLGFRKNLGLDSWTSNIVSVDLFTFMPKSSEVRPSLNLMRSARELSLGAAAIENVWQIWCSGISNIISATTRPLFVDTVTGEIDMSMNIHPYVARPINEVLPQ